MHKYKKLLKILETFESAVIAYSGGVDSTLLLKAAKDSSIKILAVTGISITVPKWDIKEAKNIILLLDVPHRFIQTDEIINKDFLKNDCNRCFHCKNILFSKLKKIALQEGYKWVIEGSNTDDLKDYRPGFKAIKIHGIRSPLIEAGLSKKDIREISKSLNLPTWNKPSSPCLSSRIPYGIPITEKALKMVSEAEEYLRKKGFIHLRVRHHDTIARIEVSEEEINQFFDHKIRKEIVNKFLTIGYHFVCLDLEGFKSGKMNRIIN